jgi:hypothetical protein
VSRADRLEELAQVLEEACAVLMRAHILARDLGFADLAAELANLIAQLRQED